MNGASRSQKTTSIRSRFSLLIQLLGVAVGLGLTGFLITRIHIIALEHALSEIGYGIVFLVLLHLVSLTKNDEHPFTFRPLDSGSGRCGRLCTYGFFDYSYPYHRA